MKVKSNKAKTLNNLMHLRSEKTLVQKLNKNGWTDPEVMCELLFVYQITGELDKMQEVLIRMREASSSTEMLADVMLKQGQLMEQQENYTAAEASYRATLRLDPSDMHTRYFGHNNLGFSLNVLGRYKDAMPYLEEAIRIEPRLPNAYKNLGLSYQGLKMYEKAAEMFVTATRVDPIDTRSYHHLEAMLQKNPKLQDTMPKMVLQLKKCKQYVNAMIH